MEVILGYVRIETLRKALQELDMDAQEKVIRRLHQDGMRKDHLSLLFGREVAVIDEIIENAPRSTRKLKVDEDGLNKYDQFIQENWPVDRFDVADEFGIGPSYAGQKIVEYRDKTQLVAAYGDVEINGELMENVLVIQFPLVEQLEQALDEGKTRFSRRNDE